MTRYFNPCERGAAAAATGSTCGVCARMGGAPSAPAAPPMKSTEERLREAREGLGLDPRRYNIAICGSSGVGKSSFINCILGRGPMDLGAAPVGVTETTESPTRYDLPGSPLTLIDFPGAGTRKFRTDSYVEDTKIYACDAIVIMYSGRLMEVCNDIVEQCGLADVCVVRSKADSMLVNLRRNEGLGPAAALEKARRVVDVEVRAAAPAAESIPRFLISVYNIEDKRDPLDYPLLAEFLRKSAASRR